MSRTGISLNVGNVSEIYQSIVKYRKIIDYVLSSHSYNYLIESVIIRLIKNKNRIFLQADILAGRLESNNLYYQDLEIPVSGLDGLPMLSRLKGEEDDDDEEFYDFMVDGSDNIYSLEEKDGDLSLLVESIVFDEEDFKNYLSEFAKIFGLVSELVFKANKLPLATKVHLIKYSEFNQSNLSKN